MEESQNDYQKCLEDDGTDGNSPYDFVMNHNEDHLDALAGFVHRTFNSTDFATFIQALQHIYRHHGGLEGVYSDSSLPLQQRISKFKTVFF